MAIFLSAVEKRRVTRPLDHVFLCLFDVLDEIVLSSATLGLLPRRHHVFVSANDKRWCSYHRQQRSQIHIDHGFAGKLEDVYTITVSQNILDHIDRLRPLGTVKETARQRLKSDQLGQCTRPDTESLGDFNP